MDVESDGITRCSDGGSGYVLEVSPVDRACSPLRPLPALLAEATVDLLSSRFPAHVFTAARGPQASRARPAGAVSDPMSYS